MIKDKEYKFSLRFIHSLNILPGSLDKITSTLQKNQFKNINKFFKKAKYQEIITRKLPFPYKFYDSFDKLNVDIEKIAIDEYYDEFSKEKCSDKKFKLFQDITKLFNIKATTDLIYVYNVSEGLNISRCIRKLYDC